MKLFKMFIIGMLVLPISTLFAKDIIKWTGCGITKKAFMIEAVKA